MIRTRLYRLLTLFFAGVGGVIFLVFFFRDIEGRYDEAFSEPRTVFLFILPFLPAFVLSMMMERSQRQFFKALEKALGDDAPPVTPMAPADNEEKP